MRNRTVCIIFVLNFIFTNCWTNPIWQNALNSTAKKNNTVLDLIALLALRSGSITISNASQNGTIQSGFIVGTSTGIQSISYSIDGGSSQTMSVASDGTWKIKIPVGGSSSPWKYGSKHSISLTGATQALTNIIKGRNHDVNGDGYADLIVGASQTTEGSDYGAAYIYYGSASVGVGTGTVAIASAETTLTAASGGTDFGSAVLLADINGDGYADAIVSDKSGTGEVSGSGAVYIFLSQGTSGLSSKSGDSGDTILQGHTSVDLFGGALATGDVNGDGYDDLLIGAPGYSSGNQLGAVFSYHGSSTGFGSSILTTSSANATFTGKTYSGNFDSFGVAVAAGDVNKDGYEDLLVGASKYVSSSTYDGAAFAFLSSGANGLVSKNLSGGDSASTTLIGTSGSGSGFGNSIALADVDGDGDSDAIVGTYSTSDNVSIFLSNGSGIPDGNPSTANATLNGSGKYCFGCSIASGDFNGDGYSDVIVGAHGGGAPDYGNTYIYLSQGSSGIASVGTSGANAVIAGTSQDAGLGEFVGSSDLNGDGIGDAIMDNNGSANQANDVYVFFGTSSGIASGDSSQYQTKLTGGSSPSDWFGKSFD